MLEYSGLRPGASFTGVAMSNGAGATAFTAGPVDAQDAGDLLIGFGLNLGGIDDALSP